MNNKLKLILAAVVSGGCMMQAAANIVVIDQSVTVPNTFIPIPDPATGGAPGFAIPSATFNPFNDYVTPLFIPGSLTVEYRITGWFYVDYDITQGRGLDVPPPPAHPVFTEWSDVVLSVAPPPTNPVVDMPFADGQYVIPGVNPGQNVTGVSDVYQSGPTGWIDAIDTTEFIAGPVAFFLTRDGNISTGGYFGTTGTVLDNWGATVELRYTFQEIPEAGTWAAIGFLGLAGFTVYRRRQSAKA